MVQHLTTWLIIYLLCLFSYYRFSFIFFDTWYAFVIANETHLKSLIQLERAFLNENCFAVVTAS